ncbi:MAG TPA: phosphoglucosamine mutase [Acidobacteriota bacterium]|nr:phosphoglucosamine mutase [Acidobacteriota bacterium]
MGRLFGTDGIRAVAGEYPLDPSTLFKLGRALVRLGLRRVVIGRDTRASGVWIQRVLERAIRAEGGEPDLVGVISTPGVSFLSRSQPFDAGLVVSASHNPYHDNGIKIFSHEGLKLSDRKEDEIEQLLAEDSEVYRMPASTFTDWESELSTFEESQISRYVEFLKQVSGRSLSPLRVVIDCANGAGFHIGPRVFTELGAEVVPMNVSPDGHNINLLSGALHPQFLMRRTSEARASLGIALDGDCDRVILSDEEGCLVDGDHMLLMLGRYFKQRGLLNSGCVVTTVMANMGLEIALGNHGLRMVRTKVGDRYVLEEMLRSGHFLGGEQSGHVIIRQHTVAGDGILTALVIARMLLEEGKPLSEFRKQLKKFPQVILAVQVREKRDFLTIESIASRIREVERRLGDKGRVLVRYSGTEPLVRIMVEGENEEEITRYAEAIGESFRAELGGEPAISRTSRGNADTR